MGTLNPTHSLTHSLTVRGLRAVCLMVYIRLVYTLVMFHDGAGLATAPLA